VRPVLQLMLQVVADWRHFMVPVRHVQAVKQMTLHHLCRACGYYRAYSDMTRSDIYMLCGPQSRAAGRGRLVVADGSTRRTCRPSTPSSGPCSGRTCPQIGSHCSEVRCVRSASCQHGC